MTTIILPITVISFMLRLRRSRPLAQLPGKSYGKVDDDLQYLLDEKNDDDKGVG